MDPKTVNIVSIFLSTFGVLLILAMAFGLTHVGGNTLLFAGVVCFILAGTLRRIAGLEDDPEEAAAAETTPRPQGSPVSDEQEASGESQSESSEESSADA
ncbi:MAG TPA: hypothetical protein DIU15_09625 [Deltaproteobacteria bacterium]|nr:hypothetical protein [Deltaproteobacteria bacterium]HCP46290.1 hypothetical protein [Deltaproteobacteria bacterium]